MEGIQTVPQSHREQVAQLVSIFGLTAQEAYDYLKTMNFDIERAVEAKINPAWNPAPTSIGNMLEFDMPKERNRRKRDMINVDEDGDGHINKRNNNAERSFHRALGLNREKKKQEFMKTYVIKKKEKPRKKMGDYPRRTKNGSDRKQINVDQMEEQFIFSTAFTDFLGEQPNITFTKDVYDVFEKMWNEKKIVAVHCLRFVTETLENNLDNLKQLYQSPPFVQAFNIDFINLGIDLLKFDFQHFAFMKGLLNKEQDNFCIVLLDYDPQTNKVVVFERLKIVDSFNLSTPQKFQQLLNKIVKRHRKVISDAQNGIKPLSQQQKQKIEMDRLIRLQQQQEYFEHFAIKVEEEKQQNLEKELGKQQLQVKVSMQEKRVYLREAMTKYKEEELTDPIELKLRLPNGNTLKLKLPKSETIDYIFNFIESNELAEMGFDDENQRNFDIVHPFDRLYLSNRRSQSLLEVFQNSSMETLAVKQI